MRDLPNPIARAEASDKDRPLREAGARQGFWEEQLNHHGSARRRFPALELDLAAAPKARVGAICRSHAKASRVLTVESGSLDPGLISGPRNRFARQR